MAREYFSNDNITKTQKIFCILYYSRYVLHLDCVKHKGVLTIEMIDHSLFGDNRARVPPDPISNSEVKPCIADGSVGFPHVRVGHRQALFRL